MIPSSGVLVIKWECPESASIVRPSFFLHHKHFGIVERLWMRIASCLVCRLESEQATFFISFFFLCGSWIHLERARSFINCLPKISRAGSSGSSEKSMLKKEPHSTTPVFFTRCRFSLLVWFWDFFYFCTLHRGPWTVRRRQKWGPKHTHEKWRADRRVNEKIIYRQMIFYLFARCLLHVVPFTKMWVRTAKLFFCPFHPSNYLWLRFFVDSAALSLEIPPTWHILSGRILLAILFFFRLSALTHS